MGGTMRRLVASSMLSGSLLVTAVACDPPWVEVANYLEALPNIELEEFTYIPPAPATPAPAAEPDPTGATHTFTVDDCACVGVDIPLLDDSSSARNDIYVSKTWPSGVEYEADGGLVCDWQTTHVSVDLSGTIRANLKVTSIADRHQAQALFGDLGQRVAEQQPWCEQDPEACTVAVADYSDGSAYLVRQYIYVGGDGVVKPSNHHADLARLIQGPDSSLVYELGVTHPELELGDTWVVDVTTAVEACVAPLAQ